MPAAKAYPLSWPLNRPRTVSRTYGRFGVSTSTEGGWRRRDKLTVAQALSRLQDELDRIGARDVVLSTNVPVRLDGLPRSDQRKPQDPGVACYFTLKGVHHCLPCDTFTDVEQNIAALAAHIGATRAIERYGVADIKAMFTGFTALPSPETASVPAWRTVLGCDTAASLDEVKIAYRRRAAETHPDRGGNAEQFNLVQNAWAMAQQEMSHA